MASSSRSGGQGFIAFVQQYPCKRYLIIGLDPDLGHVASFLAPKPPGPIKGGPESHKRGVEEQRISHRFFFSIFSYILLFISLA